MNPAAFPHQFHGLALLGSHHYLGAYDGMADNRRLIWRGLVRDLHGTPQRCRLRIRPTHRTHELLQDACTWLIAKAAGLPVASSAGFVLPQVWQLRSSGPCARFRGLADDAALPCFFTVGDDDYPSSHYGMEDALAALWRQPDAAQRWAVLHGQLSALALDWLEEQPRQRERLLAALDALQHYSLARPLPPAGTA